jgi:hypothetical protein
LLDDLLDAGKLLRGIENGVLTLDGIAGGRRITGIMRIRRVIGILPCNRINWSGLGTG